MVICDEAHNMESICAESASFDITSKDLALCINEVSSSSASSSLLSSLEVMQQSMSLEYEPSSEPFHISAK